MSSRGLGRQLAQAALVRGDPLGWFEELYRADRETPGVVSWADLVPNPHLVPWLDGGEAPPATGAALVVGSGYGDDAEELARRGYAVTAFDIARTATAAARERFPDGKVAYVTADLLAAPAEWESAFDLVAEIYTLQVLPPELRGPAARAMARFVAPGGTLLAIARGRDRRTRPARCRGRSSPTSCGACSRTSTHGGSRTSSTMRILPCGACARPSGEPRQNRPGCRDSVNSCSDPSLTRA